MPTDMLLPLEGADYFIYYLDLPPKIFAFVMLNADDTYSIFMDARRSHDQQLDDYFHELWHIIREDLHNGKPIWVVEAA